MLDQLQAGEEISTEEVATDLQPETTEATEIETTEHQDGSDSTPDNGGGHEKITFSEDQQKVLDKAIGRQTHKAREAERQAEKLRLELEEAKKQIPKAERPAIPELPDPYDDDYEDRLKARDAAISAAAQFDARETYRVEQEQAQQAARRQSQVEALQANQESYNEKMEALKLPKAELQLAAMKVEKAGISLDLLSEVMSSESGPLLTMHLADNPDDLALLNSLSGDHLKRYLNAAIVPQLKAPKAQPSSPPPIDTERGGGASTEHPALKGVKFK